jgi:6-phosphogluconolactonase
MTRLGIFVTICLCLSSLAGCGGGNQANPSSNALTNSPGPTSTGAGNGSTSGTGHSTTTIVSGNKPRVLLGNTYQFTSSYSDATWEVNRVPGGNDLFGTISSTGLYTAPAVVPFGPVVTIIARSHADNSATFWFTDVGALTGAHFAYVSSASDNSIQIFTADEKTGNLQAKSIFSVGPGKAPAALALSANGNFLYSLNRGTNDISIYSINSATGDLTNAGTVAVPTGPYAMVFSVGGDYAYVSCDGASTIAAYSVNLSTGALTPLSAGSYVAGGGRVQSLAISFDGDFLYAANPDANQIIALAVLSDGSLSPIPGSPFTAQPGLSSIVLSEGDYAYDNQQLLAGSANGIEVYNRTPSSGALTYLPSATLTTAGKSPILFSSDGLLMGVNPQSGGGFSYAFDYLAPVYPSAHLSPGGSPVSTGISPVAGGWLWNTSGPNWVYVLNGKANASSTTGSIGVYPVDYSTGMVGPTTVIPTSLHSPAGFVVTP